MENFPNFQNVLKDSNSSPKFQFKEFELRKVIIAFLSVYIHLLIFREFERILLNEISHLSHIWGSGKKKKVIVTNLVLQAYV